MSSSNTQNNNPISITKGYLSPTLSPSFFPLNVGDDSSMPFMSLDKSTNNTHNMNGSSAMVTTSLSKLGDITRGRGRQRSLSNSSFTGGETPLSMLTKRTSSVSPIRFPSSTTSTTTTNARSTAPRMFNPEYFKTHNVNATSNSAATLSSLLANHNASNNAATTSAHHPTQSTANFNSIAQFLSSSLIGNQAPVEKKKKKKIGTKQKKAKQEETTPLFAVPSVPSGAASSASASTSKRQMTPVSCAISETTSSSSNIISDANELRITRSNNASQRKTSHKANQIATREIPLENENFASRHEEFASGNEDFVSGHKDKDSMIEKFLDQGQKHPFITGNIAEDVVRGAGSSSRHMKKKNSVHSEDDEDEEEEEEDDDDDDIPIDFVEMVEQSGLLDNTIDDASPQELMSHAKRLRNTKNVHKHMKRYSHISAYSSVTTAVPAQAANQWEASMNERHQNGATRPFSGHDGRLPYDQDDGRNRSSSPVKSQQEVTSETQLASYSSSQYEMAERQLRELQQQQVDLKMQQLQLQIEELRLTNDRLRYAIDEKKQYSTSNNGSASQSNMSLGQGSMNEYEMGQRVKLLESKIGDYEAVISQLTRASSMGRDGSSSNAQQHQISNHEHHSSEEPWTNYESTPYSPQTSNHNNNALRDANFDEAGSCTMSNCDSQLHVKKLRLSKIDSTQLEQLTRSRTNSRSTSETGSPLKAGSKERENRRHSKNIEHLEDYPFTTRNITGEDDHELKLDEGTLNLEDSAAPQNNVNVLKDISNTTSTAQPQSAPMSTMSSSHSDTQMSQWKQSMQTGSYQHKHSTSISMESTCSNDTSVSRHSNKRSRAGYNLNLSIELKK
ncbi:hypothetical protein ACO0RG_004348 [Hanseniaspora osmophila]